jgi:transposase, IS5 family
MIRTVSPQATLWESVIPQCLMGLPGDLAEIDALLDDERFFEPFRPFFDPLIGRPSIPMETYIRMMFLKYRYVRHEAPPDRVGCKDPPSGCRSSPLKLGAA